jgi:hypothetical protein
VVVAGAAGVALGAPDSVRIFHASAGFMAAMSVFW